MKERSVTTIQSYMNLTIWRSAVMLVAISSLAYIHDPPYSNNDFPNRQVLLSCIVSWEPESQECISMSDISETITCRSSVLKYKTVELTAFEPSACIYDHCAALGFPFLTWVEAVPFAH